MKHELNDSNGRAIGQTAHKIFASALTVVGLVDASIIDLSDCTNDLRQVKAFVGEAPMKADLVLEKAKELYSLYKTESITSFMAFHLRVETFTAACVGKHGAGGRTEGRRHGRKDERTDGRMDGLRHGRMDGHTEERTERRDGRTDGRVW